MINLTEIAKKYNKRIDNWTRLKSSQAFIEKYKDSFMACKGLAEIVEGETGYGGTFACEEIALAFEQWCQKDFREEPSRVYFIRGDKTNSFKIGISSNPRNRLKTMQTGSPVKLLLTRDIEVLNPVEIERLLHKEFAKYKIHGEWFSMPWKDAIEIFDSIVDPWSIVH